MGMKHSRNRYVLGLLSADMDAVPGTGMEYKRRFASTISLLE